MIAISFGATTPPNHTLHPPDTKHFIPQPWLCRVQGREFNRRLLPSSSSFTSLAAVSPSSLRFFSMALLRSRAALSSALRVHPMVREHSLMAVPVPGSTEEMAIKRWICGHKAGSKSPFFVFLSSVPSIPLWSLLLSLSGQLPLCRSRTGVTAPLQHLNQRSTRFDPRRQTTRWSLRTSLILKGGLSTVPPSVSFSVGKSR